LSSHPSQALPTTNLLERSFLEERRRTRTIPRFCSEKSRLKLVFATLLRASYRWLGVKISELEREQLRLLRKELRTLPDHEHDTVALGHEKIAV
jgi:transposase-like protein